MNKKLYYIDENGNKKYYIGKVINDHVTNEKYGLLTVQEKIQQEVELEYHPEQPKEEGWSSYFTYLNEDNSETKYIDDIHNIRKNFDGSYYITKVNKISINLTYHPAIEAQSEYFTYQDSDGNEYIYNDKVFFDKFTNTYYFYK